LNEAANSATDSTPKRLGQIEFIALMGILFAFVAFSIDAMLPALPQIASELIPTSPNSAQLIITSFVIGMGIGTLLAGPLSDSFGRRTIIVVGAGLYVLGAIVAWAGETLEMVLLGRALQGLGAAGPRVVALAIVRDLYEGRQMARIVSFAMMVFTLVPAVAPLIGSLIIAEFGWRSIFPAFIAFSVLSVGWLVVRQPETLPGPKRRPFSFAPFRLAVIEVMSHRAVALSIATQTLIYGMLFGAIASVQPIFDITFNRAEAFPYWFGALALICAIPSLVNAAIVVRFGMRRLIRTALLVQCIVSAIALLAMTALPLGIDAQFLIYYIWTVCLFSMLGFTIGNLNALALQPMGHIAGTASSVMSATATLLGGALGAPLGLAFNGTPVPLAAGILVLGLVAWGLMRIMPKTLD
jgi:DHA1 family bicyclomycin/chloramphenicol resistance-like MFS transporter